MLNALCEAQNKQDGVILGPVSATVMKATNRVFGGGAVTALEKTHAQCPDAALWVGREGSLGGERVLSSREVCGAGEKDKDAHFENNDMLFV